MRLIINKYFTRFFLLLCLLALCLFSSCGGGGGEVVPDNFKLLQGTWQMQNVKVDGVDKSSLFIGLAVTFTASGYTSSNGEPVWPLSGTWTKGADASTINKNDGLTVTIQSISASAATLSLNWNKNTLGGGRQMSVSGQHVFTFGR